MKILSVGQEPSFGRKPNAKEMKVYTCSLNKGLQLLNKQVDIILHNASAPAVKSENTGIGSLFSKTVAEKLMPFLKAHAISNIQQEPNGLRKIIDASPYAPEANAKNIYMIPLEKLASDEYGNILSKKTFDEIVKNNPDKENVDYKYVRKSYDRALKEAYNNAKNSPEFEKFKAERETMYEKDAIYRVLCEEKGDTVEVVWGDKTQYSGAEMQAHLHSTGPESWSELDKNLYARTSKETQDRIKELKSKERYNLYLFEQMILEKESASYNELAKKTGINIIGDSPVAQSAVDEWIHNDLFLKDKALGCPPDYFSPDGQRWNFKYYDPAKMFNKDGSLAEAGIVLKKKYEDYFKNFSGGIRIDHIIGLIDPFIYAINSSKMTPENSGRIFSIAGKYQKHTTDEYANIISKIIIPAAEKYGLDKSAIICEDLGEKTKPVADVMDKLQLSGIAVTQFDYRGSKTPAKDTIMIGSHDNSSFLEFVRDLFKNPNDHRFLRKTWHLAEDTAPKGSSHEVIKKECDKIRADKLKFISASFTELFASPAKRVQIFFTDLFGIPKTYNRPGTTGDNWSLRLGESFEKDYYEAASKGLAPNLPKSIAEALRQRGLDKGNEALMKDLEKSAAIIAE